MHNHPRILFEIITFLTKALPIRSIPTFIELLVGAMITRAGFVTEAWLAINPVRNWRMVMGWPWPATGKGCRYLFSPVGLAVDF